MVYSNATLIELAHFLFSFVSTNY